MIAVRQFFANGAFWEYCDLDGVWLPIMAHENNYDPKLAFMFKSICSCEFYVGKKLDTMDASEIDRIRKDLPSLGDALSYS